MRYRRLAPLCLLAPLFAASAAAQPGELFDAQGYRQIRFQAPVSREPHPANRIAAAAAAGLRPNIDALFIDVLPTDGGVRDPGTGRWRLPAPHLSVPGALWHPETGRAPPDPQLWQGLRDAVASARRKHPGIPVILYCRTDCWMGWNAARRLAGEGVPNVWWLADGIEGWRREGGKLAPVEPTVITPR